MKKLCRKCAHFYDRKLTACPYCGFSNAKKAEKAEEVKPEFIDDSGNKIPESSHTEIKWVPKRKRKIEKHEGIKLGGVHIDVTDVSYFGRKGKLNYVNNKNVYTPKEPTTANLSKEDPKKYELPKLKWWEIYRWADRVLARRKIKKYVNKEARQKPKDVSYTITLLLCLLTGYLGFHNIYVKNYAKGFTTFGLFMVSFFVIALQEVFPWLSYIQYSIGATFGLIALIMWIWDLSSIIFKRFKYRTSKMQAIYNLDVETRAVLGKKYIVM